MILLSILIIFISINVVSAADNITDTPSVSEVILNTSDVDLLGENLVYNATLTSLNNTPLHNQTIIFSVNGINYTRVTNLEGISFLNINLNDGIYPISTIFRDSNNHSLINNNIIYVSHSSGTLIKDSLSGAEIQKIIDEANSYDTLIFAGKNYKDVSININKPLSITNIVKSVFNGISGSPVITVSSNNVNISNIVISKGSIGILLNNVENVKIVSNDITNNDKGILLKNSVNTNISSNNFLNNYEGIYFDENVLNTQIVSNYMSKSGNNAINFAKSGSHTNVSGNTLEKNENGIFIDMVGDDDLNIEFNTIQRNRENGIYFGSNYHKTNETGILNIANNSIVYNSGFNILARDSIYNRIDLNTNWIAGINPRFDGICAKIKFNKYAMNVNQVDSNTLSVSVDGIKTSSLLKYSTNGGKNWQYVSLVDGKATINVNNADGNLMFDYYGQEDDYYQYQMEDYVPPSSDDPVTPTTPDVPTTPDDSQSSSDTPSGNGASGQSKHVDGNGTSTNQNSGSSQSHSSMNVDSSSNALEQSSAQSAESAESVSNQESSQADSSSSNSQSVSKQVSDPTQSIAKALNIDEETVRIAGMGFILLLIILVIAGYYRDDVKYMLNKRNEH